MKPTHGFKNPLIGFGERLGRKGEGSGRGRGLKEVTEQSRYQSQQTAPPLSNEQEGLVNKFASTACNGDASDSGRNLRLAVTAAGTQQCIIRRKSQCVAGTSPAPPPPKKKEKKKENQYCAIPPSIIFFFAAGEEKKSVSSLLCVL